MSSSADRGHELSGFSLHVEKGEILGILGHHYAGKHKILELLTGRCRREPDSGIVFFEEMEYDWTDYAEAASKAVVFLEKDSYLFDRMTIEENVELLWKLHRKKRMGTHRARRRLIQVMLSEYGFELDPRLHVFELTELEKMRLQLIVGLQKQTKLICIDFSGTEWTRSEFRKWKQLFSELTDRGMGVIIFDHQMSSLQTLSDRVAFLYRGRILKVMENVPAEKVKMDQAIRTLFPERGDQNYQKNRAKSEDMVLNIQDLPLNNGKSLTLPLRKGEFTVVYGSDMDTFAMLQEQFGSRRIAGQDGGKELRLEFIDIRYIDSVIEEVSPLENCVLGLLHRFAVLGFTKSSALRYIEKDFAQWYGDDRLLQLADSRNLARRERVALNLYRIRLRRPQIIFFSDIYLQNDLAAVRMVSDQILEFLGDGAAVCMLTSDYNFSNSLVDHYVILGEKNGERDG